MTIARLAYMAAMLFAADHQPLNLYPDVRTIIHEAEISSTHIAVLDDSSRPLEWEGHLYAPAGYLDDASRIFRKAASPPWVLLKARVVYDDLDGAETAINSVSDRARKAKLQIALGELLWRMNKPTEAKKYLAEARRCAPQVSDPASRQGLLAAVETTSTYLQNDPPDILSATPKPEPRRPGPENSAIPQFPITADGFNDLDSNEAMKQANENAALMKQLYDLMAQNNEKGLISLVDKAPTAFQKALALASVEHILIQANHPDTAENYARNIPEADPPSSLAKAEALSGAAASWLRAGNANRASAAFTDAVGLANSVKTLPMGRVYVLLSIAEAEAKGGMIATSGETLNLAAKAALALPNRPAVVKSAPLTTNGPIHRDHYRDQAYGDILLAAITTHNLGMAHATAELWRKSGGRNSTEIMEAWLDADQPGEAIAFAHALTDTADRVKTQLALAQQLLDKAGAPNI